VFFVVLAYYDIKILIVYSFLTVIAVAWAVFFLHKRKILDYQSFQQRAENQDSIYELINGIQEIKLHNFEKYKRSSWENIQVKLFHVNQRILKLDQFQGIGFNFINHLKNILVTFIAANEVIKGNISLGALLAISYIIGQMNSPVNQIINFFRSWQDARISLDRLGEVHQQKEEETKGQIILSEKEVDKKSNGYEAGIRVQNLNFQYEGPQSPLVLNNINLFIPKGKV